MGGNSEMGGAKSSQMANSFLSNSRPTAPTVPTIMQPKGNPMPTLPNPQPQVPQQVAPPAPTMPAGFRQYGSFGIPALDKNIPKGSLDKFKDFVMAPDGNAYNTKTGKWTTKDGSPLAEGGMAGDANRAIGWFPQSVYAGQASQFYADQAAKKQQGGMTPMGTGPQQLSDAQRMAREINARYGKSVMK